MQTVQEERGAACVGGGVGLSPYGQRDGRSFATGSANIGISLLPLAWRRFGNNLLDNRFDFVIVDSEAGCNAAVAVAGERLSNHRFRGDFPLLLNDFPYVLIGTAADGFV